MSYAFLFGLNMIAAITCSWMGWLVLTRHQEIKEKTYGPLLPTIAIFFVTYQIGALFMSIYGIATDTIFYCYLIDVQNCRGTAR